MAGPTDLVRGSTNAFSPESLISKNLMDQALKNERDRIATLYRQASTSDSDDEKTTSSYQKKVKTGLNRKESSLRHIFFPCCCIQ